MKKEIDYFSQKLSMSALLESQNVSLKDDFSEEERKNLRQYLEEYLVDGREETKIDLKKFILIIKGADEAGYLYGLL